MAYTSIQIEGGLLSPDFLEHIHEAAGQKPADFGLAKNRSLVDEVSAVWSDVRAYWTAFQRRLARAHDAESYTTITRDQWVRPLLETLGYQLAYQRRATLVDGESYAISHREIGLLGPGTEEENGPPIHIVAIDQELGKRPPAGRGRMSPHALLQDYLNHTDHLWGVLTNGTILRLLRDSTYFSRPAYIEFDLAQMLADERFDEFILLYRLLHRSRLPATLVDGADCRLETYHQAALEQGGRIRDGLRDAVEEAIRVLGNGFLRHPQNEALRARLQSGTLTATAYYQQLLYLIYRLLFLMVAEERNLLSDQMTRGQDDKMQHDGHLVIRSSSHLATASHYQQLSISRLRTLAAAPLNAPQRFDDLYLGLRTLFAVLRDDALAGPLGVTALNGELFQQSDDVDGAYLNNADLLTTVRLLAYFTPKDENVQRRVNYAALDVEELGSVYESLLDEHPVIHPSSGSSPGKGGGMLRFDLVYGTERKTTGSYYTPRELVKELIDSALQPVIDDRLADAGKEPTEREKALLALNVCDPACGSGHFLLAAARRIGRALAQVRSGEEEPAPEIVRAGVRDAITHCIYGVDKNPLAVDLCKVALWIEGHNGGKPLTFLDYHIRCGDSLVGVQELAVLTDGIPDDAYSAVTGDDKKTATACKRRNKQERAGQLDLFAQPPAATPDLAAQWQALIDLPEETPAQVRTKRTAFDRLTGDPAWQRLQTACHLWTAAFFAELTGNAQTDLRTATTGDLRTWLGGGQLDGRKTGYATALAHAQRFFHWPLQFPQIFARGGFDVVLGNPPWERIKLQEKEWFAARSPAIAHAPNAAARKKLIAALKEEDPVLWQEFQRDVRAAESESHFIRNSEQYPLCGRGDVNTYAVFAELARHVQGDHSRASIIVPTGIATDDTTKFYFQDIVRTQTLISLHSFENEEFVFPDVHHAMKFCLLTLSGNANPSPTADFFFFARNVAHLRDDNRHFSLSAEDIFLLNPNSGTCPIFRTKRDAELTKAIYRRVPVLIKEESPNESPWGVKFTTIFHMSSDSHLFRTGEQLAVEGWELVLGAHGVRFVRNGEDYLPLYEAKMLHQFNHRFGDYADRTEETGSTALPDIPLERLNDPEYAVMPRYWVHIEEVKQRLSNYPAGWLVAFRDITNATNERTAIFSILPRVGVGHTAPMLFSANAEISASVLVANINSFIFDYAARQSVGGTHLTYSYLKQLPIFPPDLYCQCCGWMTHASDFTLQSWLLPRVLELTYTAWDLQPFARDCGYDGPPFRWDEERRFLLRCELDAAYFHLYGIARDDVDYILETFPIVKRKDEAAHGEYHTKRVILEIYDAMATARRTGVPYQTRLDPPPADPLVAHPPQ